VTGQLFSNYCTPILNILSFIVNLAPTHIVPNNTKSDCIYKDAHYNIFYIDLLNCTLNGMCTRDPILNSKLYYRLLLVILTIKLYVYNLLKLGYLLSQ